jgi:hypothetical protein
MKQNVGTIDRIVRGIAGIALIASYALEMVAGTAGIVMLVIGIVLLGTVITGWCPPYLLMGINTKGTESAE